MLPLISPSRFNSIRSLPYLMLSLAAWTISLYSSQAVYPCFHHLWASLLCLSLSRGSLFIHICSLAFLPDFLLGIHYSWSWKRQSLSINQFSLGPSSLQGFISQYSTQQIPEEAKVSSPDKQGSELAVLLPH